MNRIVRHRPEEGKPLYDYHSVSSYSDCADRIICLSERDFNIILNALSTVEKAKTRVYVSRPGQNLFEIASSEQFGTFTTYITNIYERMGDYMACNEYLERIAISLETMVEEQDKQTLNLFDVLEAMGIEADPEQADLLEALQYILGLANIDLLPDFNIPKVEFLKSIGDWRFKGAIVNMMQDIAVSQRGQTVAQGGVDMAGIYDDLGDTVDKLLLPAGFVGKAIWLWNRIKPVDIPNWVGWLGGILGLTLGSIRNATYDVAQAIEELELGVTLPEMSPVINVECSQCGSTSGCGCSNDPSTGIVSGNTPIIDIQDTAPVEEPDREGDPPTGSGSWEEYDAAKCAWVNKILDDYKATLRNYGGFFGLVGGLTVAVITGVTLITIPPLGLAVLMAALGGILTIDIAAFAYFSQIADGLDDDPDLLCELYNSTTTDDMIGVLNAVLTEIIPSLPLMPPGVESRLIDACQAMNTNVLWSQAINHDGTIPSGYEETICDCGGDPIAFVTSFYCEATVISGEFVSGEEVTLESCLSGPEIIGAIRHQVAIQTTDYPTNATIEIVSISAGDYIVAWNDGSTPQTPETYGSAAATAGWVNPASALQVSRWTENVTTVPFTVTLKVTTIP